MPTHLVGNVLHDQAGSSLGKITDVISDPVTLDPELVTVKPGWFRREHLVPVTLVHERGDSLVVDTDALTVYEAPTAGRHTAPTDDERAVVYTHYGLPVPPSGRERLTA